MARVATATSTRKRTNKRTNERADRRQTTSNDDVTNVAQIRQKSSEGAVYSEDDEKPTEGENRVTEGKTTGETGKQRN